MASRNLCVEDRARIIDLHELGRNISQITQELGFSRNTVRLWVRRHKEGGHLVNQPRRPHQFIINDRQALEMVTQYAVQPFTPTRVFAEQFDCDLKTVRRALQRAGIHRRKPAVKVILTEQNKAERVRFAREYRDFDFSHAIFADEKCFKTTQIGRRNLWRVENPRYEPPNDTNNMSVNMWGWMSAAGPGELLEVSGATKDSYLELLQESMLPTVRVVYPQTEVPEFIFIHNNCRAHTAPVVKNWLHDQPEIRTVRWPSRSPDLNPMENLWGVMVQRWDALKERSRENLIAHCDRVWDSLRGSDLCEILVRSMRSRFDDVIDSKGAMTKY